MIFSGVYLLVRCLLGCVMVLARREVSKDAELLVLRHENAVLRRHTGRVGYELGDRLWLAALSRLVARKWDYTSRWRPGRPPAPAAIRKLVILYRFKNLSRCLTCGFAEPLTRLCGTR